MMSAQKQMKCLYHSVVFKIQRDTLFLIELSYHLNDNENKNIAHTAKCYDREQQLTIRLCQS